MSSHRGLGQYKTGADIRYAKDERLAITRIPLFPLQEELAVWAAEGKAQEGKKIGEGWTEVQSIWSQAHQRMHITNSGWQECAIVDDKGWAQVRRHANSRHTPVTTYTVPLQIARGLQASSRPLPLVHQAPATDRPQLPAPPPEWLVREVAETLQGWEDCVTEKARQQLQSAVEKSKRDATILTGSPRESHRQRAKCGASGAEARLGPDMYHPTVNKALRLGYTIDLTKGAPKIRELRPLTQEEWGINARCLLRDAKKINWPDRELLFFLEYGFMDYSGNTPPICSFSPHQQKAMHNFPTFREQVQEEMRNGWIGPQYDHPPSVPFQVRPGSLEPKPGGKWRLVWNASWPAPGSYERTVILGDEWVPIAPNASTALPSTLEFEWTAIETNNEIIEIMATGAQASGAPLLGRTFDIAKWFRQLGMATLDRWKCTVHVEGGFREDICMQMGRRSSAHSAQRATFLLTALLQRAAIEEKWGISEERARRTEQQETEQEALKKWLKSRETVWARPQPQSPLNIASTKEQPCLVYFSSFQDDITAVAVGTQAAKDATEGVKRILQQKYGVPLSSKREATSFATIFTSIGATYNLSNPSRIECHPRTGKKTSTRL